MEKIRAQLELLSWVIRLTHSGMPVSMFRRFLFIKKEDLEKALADNEITS